LNESTPLLSPIRNITRDFLLRKKKIDRKHDFYSQVKHCSKNPYVYGHGKVAGFGRLWTGYMHLSRANPSSSAVNLTELISSISQALRPSSQSRKVDHQCVQHHQAVQSISSYSQGGSGYVALHVRVEVEMMVHTCGRTMEKNWTKIVIMVEEMMAEHNGKTTTEEQVKGVFVAVSRHGMQQATNDNVIDTMAKENWKTLLRLRIVY
jgi:hypothetical protein